MYEYDILNIVPPTKKGKKATTNFLGKIETNAPISAGFFINYKEGATYVVNGVFVHQETGRHQLLVQFAIELNFEISRNEKPNLTIN